MSDGEVQPPTASPAELESVLRRLAAIVVPVTCLLPVSFALPEVDLHSGFVLACLALTDTGGAQGIPFVILLSLAVIISRPGLDGARRAREGGLILLGIAVVFGSAAYANEFLIKERMAVPRPIFRALAADGRLGVTPEELYGKGGKDERRAYLSARFAEPEVAARLDAHPRVVAHWAHETGYSFPSGHSLASTSFATCFLALGLTFVGGRRLWFFYGLPLWGLGVCFTRVILRVHSPTDVTVGGTLGLFLGVGAFLAARWLVLRWGLRASSEQVSS